MASKDHIERSESKVARAISSSAWLEEHRSLYEANKDMRHLREDHPTKPGYQITYMLYPDNPRYEEGYVTWFVQKYKRCLELHEEYDQLVKEMILQYELEEASVNELLKSRSS